jgi:hypothetical protein
MAGVAVLAIIVMATTFLIAEIAVAMETILAVALLPTILTVVLAALILTLAVLVFWKLDVRSEVAEGCKVWVFMGGILCLVGKRRWSYMKGGVGEFARVFWEFVRQDSLLVSGI